VESLLNRYRNITVLLLVIMAQLVLLAVSAKNPDDVRFIRIWTVTAVTPVARIIEGLRGGSTGFLHNYILLHDTNRENQRLRSELDRMKMENVFLKNEINTSDRAQAIQVFQQHTPSKTVAATIIATGAGSSSKVVFVDRGTMSGVQRGMAVVTPDGIVGKVIAAYPTASQVLLITDPDFAAGVVTEKSQVHGTLKGQGTPQCKVDYVAFEEKVEPGEWVYTSGDDRIFPRGFRVGVVKAVRPGQPFKEILVEPSGMQRGLVEDVLILIEGVHQRIPDAPSGMQPIYIAAPPPGNDSTPAAAAPAPVGTEADRLRSQYQALGEEQKHKYGENLPGAKPPDFTKLANPGGGGQGGDPLGPAGKSTVAPAGALPVAPAAVPPAAPPAAPAKTGTGGRAGDPQGPPAKSGPPPAGTPAIHPPDAAQRLNPAGTPAGGQIRR
jgi:rod shape-determining protein MreC